MEIKFFLDNLNNENSELLLKHVTKMASGKELFLPATLGLVYDKLIEKTLAPPTASGPGKPSEIGNEAIFGIVPSTLVASSFTFTSPPRPSPQTARPTSGPRTVRLKCSRCGESARLRDLYEGVRCPRCSSTGIKRSLMSCPLCDIVRGRLGGDRCVRNACQVKFA